MFLPEGMINEIKALVQIMAWRLSGDKPLPEPMLTQFTDAYMWHTRGDELTTRNSRNETISKGEGITGDTIAHHDRCHPYTKYNNVVFLGIWSVTQLKSSNLSLN